VPPDGYHKRTFDLCREHDILYISDEVVTGFGRLGHWFASKEVFGIQPDMITCAKGLTSGYLPLGACIISDSMMERMTNNGEMLFSNGYTYSGHPLASAAAVANPA
jgi:adenosylmethionine-8-amino-7-oxononanoate aminotransferase